MTYMVEVSSCSCPGERHAVLIWSLGALSWFACYVFGHRCPWPSLLMSWCERGRRQNRGAKGETLTIPSVHLNTAQESNHCVCNRGVSGWGRPQKETLWWEGMSLQSDGHCCSFSPPGTKKPMGLESHRAPSPVLAMLSCLITALRPQYRLTEV